MNKRELLWRFGLPAAVMLGGLLLGLGAGILMDKIELRQAGEAQTLPAEAPADGVGRITAARYLGGARSAMPERAVRIAPEHYTEGEGPAPEWWMPDEPMAVEWQADFADLFVEADEMVDVDDESYRQVEDFNDEAVFKDSGEDSGEAEQVTDAGCPDWNLETGLTGWDGHRAEPWELDLYARIVYLEFWGTSPECCEAGADSILRLWESGYFGDDLSDTLTATAEDGSLVYSPYAYVWDWDYDPDGLRDMRELCEERFFNGPEWIAPYFRLWYYHDWAEDAYEIDGVCFSVPRG